MMNSLMEDLWAIILARLPLKSITSSKLVCKEWKSIVESPFLRELFLSHHQNSHTSWSLMCRESHIEVIAHYGCEIWGLPRPLCSYISSFLNDNFEIQKKDWFRKDEEARVVSYTDVGFILIKLKKPFYGGNLTYFVANPISRQCVEIPPTPHNLIEVHFFRPSGLSTRIENGVVLGYKVVLMRTRYLTNNNVRDLLVYSSETGLWSFETLHSPIPLVRVVHYDPVSLNGNLYWLGRSLGSKEVVISHDFYAESDQYRVILFPDSEKEPNFRRACTTSQGFLMYMNADKDDNVSLEHKLLSVWRLKSEEWQLLTQISLPCIKTRFDYFPMAINPFDAHTMYLQSNLHSCMASTNLLHKGKFRFHNNLERSSDGPIASFDVQLEPPSFKDTVMEGFHAYYTTFVLPRWLYRIPSPPPS